MRLWKRKWFVLADFCLFYYKGLCFFVVNIKLYSSNLTGGHTRFTLFMQQTRARSRVCVRGRERERERWS